MLDALDRWQRECDAWPAYGVTPPTHTEFARAFLAVMAHDGEGELMPCVDGKIEVLLYLEEMAS